MAEQYNEWNLGAAWNFLRILAQTSAAIGSIMVSLKEINKLVNRALRATNQVAANVASSKLRDRETALHEITQALAHIDNLQRLIVVEDPKLEYHFDENRKPSLMMRKISSLVETAESHVREGRLSTAAEFLRRACEMEPPPLVYEMIEKRLKSLGLKGSASRSKWSGL